MKYCTNCGMAIENELNFCPECGTQCSPAPSDPAPAVPEGTDPIQETDPIDQSLQAAAALFGGGAETSENPEESDAPMPEESEEAAAPFGSLPESPQAFVPPVPQAAPAASPIPRQTQTWQTQSPGQTQTWQRETDLRAQTASKSNGLAVGGFVVSVCTLLFVAVPVLGLIFALTGLGLSIAGMIVASRRGGANGLAIAGLVISIIFLITTLYVNFLYMGGLHSLFYTIMDY